MSRRPKKSFAKKTARNSGPPPAASVRAHGLAKHWKVLAVCAGLVLLIVIVFAQTLRFGFVNYDDDTNVYQAPQVIAGLSLAGAAWAITHTQAGRWTPVATLSRMLDCQLFGLWPGGHHLTNLLLHTLTTLALFFALQRLTGSLWPSAFVAALFAIHPLHVEAVAWISARGELLSGLFFMLALWTYAIHAGQVRRAGPVPYAASLLCFLLGLMSKPSIVTLPFLLLLLDYWPLQRLRHTPLARLLIEKIPFFLLSAAACILTTQITQPQLLVDQLSLPLRLQNALLSYSIYLGQTLWPAHLAAFYPQRHSFPLWQIAAALLLLAILSAAAWFLRKKQPALLVGWLWYVGMLIPVIGIVQASSDAHADRYTYLPQIGLCIALAWPLGAWCDRPGRHRSLMLALAALTLAALLIPSARLTASWADSETLWTHALSSTQDNYVAHNNLANVLCLDNRLSDAVDQYLAAIRINPRYADPRANLAHILIQQGRPADAIAQYLAALRIDPTSPLIHERYGTDLYQMGRIPDAQDQFLLALQTDPDYADAHTCLGNVLLYQGRLQEAIHEYLQALRISPTDPLASRNLGNLLLIILEKTGPRPALAASEAALAAQPANPNIQNALAWILATSGLPVLRDGPRAIALAVQASHASGGQDPVTLRTLAAAYAQAGQFANACQTAQSALSFAQSTGQASLAGALRQELALYSAGRPYPASP